MIEDQYLNEIRKILKKAGDTIIKYYREENITVEIKSDNSPVTIADLESEKIIIEALSKLTPEIEIVSEESADGSKASSEKDQFWLIDPLDGTREFINKTDEFCIIFSLIKNGIPVEGYIYAPIWNTLWYAVQGEGAWMVSDNEKVKLPSNIKEGDFKILKSRSHHGHGEDQWIKKAEHKTKLSSKSQGSAIKFCLIAEGKADFYIKTGPIYEWDIAAGSLLLKESGGGLIDIKNGKEPVFTGHSKTVPYFIAYGHRIDDPRSWLL